MSSARERLVKQTVKVDLYAIISRAVEEGLRYGWRRAHKHTDKPDEQEILDQQEQAVLNEICEVVDFGDDPAR